MRGEVEKLLGECEKESGNAKKSIVFNFLKIEIILAGVSSKSPEITYGLDKSHW